jgi:guanylate kinase
MSSPSGKVIILASPSGGGKSTMKDRLIKTWPEIRFSVSATTRAPRHRERDGVDYIFLDDEAFDRAISEGRFLEWETVYTGRRYGTLRSEVDKHLEKGYFVLFDVDVLGAASIKRHYGDKALSIYLKPPSLDILKERLERRGTDSHEEIAMRMERAAMELDRMSDFDRVIVNDDLETAWNQLRDTVQDFLQA